VAFTTSNSSTYYDHCADRYLSRESIQEKMQRDQFELMKYQAAMGMRIDPSPERQKPATAQPDKRLLLIEDDQ